jgi:hypothetical protein
MNDLQELRLGVNRGAEIIAESKVIAEALATPERANDFAHHFTEIYYGFSQNEAINVYVFCCSQHEPSNDDGVLPMWRGYGGDGSGVALVADTSALVADDSSAFMFSSVRYQTNDERERDLRKVEEKVATIFRSADIPTVSLYSAAYAVFYNLVVRALLTKHRAFDSEREWRLVYLGPYDRDKAFEPLCTYRINGTGIEPVLKLPVARLIGERNPSLGLEQLIERIIVGPSFGGAMSLQAFKGMLRKLDLTSLTDKVVCSQIPFRSRRWA